MMLGIMLLCVPCLSIADLPLLVSRKGLSDVQPILMEINGDATVAQLKQKIAVEFGIRGVAPKSLLLESPGQSMNDLGQSLADAGICAETRVQFSIQNQELRVMWHLPSGLQSSFCCNVSVGHEDLLPYILDEVKAHISEEERARMQGNHVVWTMYQIPAQHDNRSRRADDEVPFRIPLGEVLPRSRDTCNLARFMLPLTVPRFRVHLVEKLALTGMEEFKLVHNPDIQRVVDTGKSISCDTGDGDYDVDLLVMTGGPTLAFGQLDQFDHGEVEIVDGLSVDEMQKSAQNVQLMIEVYIPPHMNLVINGPGMEIEPDTPMQMMNCDGCPHF